MDLNLKRFLAYYGKIILMPEILMSVYRCIKIGALYCNYRYIFVIKIGKHINIRYKNRYATQKCDKNRYICHKNRYIYDILKYI